MPVSRNELIYRHLGLVPGLGMHNQDGQHSVVESSVMASYKWAYDEGDNLMDDITSTNGSTSYLSASNGVQLEIQGASGDKQVRQTHERFRYIPGKFTSVKIGIRGLVKDGVKWWVGMYEGDDIDDGTYLLVEDGVAYHVVRSTASGSLVERKVSQKNWNQDRLNKPINRRKSFSNEKLDVSKIQMVSLVVNWYGAGESSLYFKIGGRWILANTIHAGNTIEQPIYGEPTLPVQLGIENTSATGETSNLNFYGLSVETGGDLTDIGVPHSVLRDDSVSAGTTEYTSVLAIQPKTILKTKKNRRTFRPASISLFAESNPAAVKIIRNATITAAEPSWTSVHPDSGMNYSTSIDADFSGGREVGGGGFIATGQGGRSGMAQAQPRTRFPLTINADGTVSDSIIVAAKGIGQASDVRAQIEWIEI